MAIDETIVFVPKDLSNSGITSLILKLNVFYSYKDKQISKFYLDFVRVEKVELLGVLLIYKFLEYSVVNSCFTYPSLNLFENARLSEEIRLYGFESLFKSLIRNKDAIKDYQNLKVEVKGDFIIAPFALLRDNDFRSETLNRDYLPMISNYYNDKKKALMIFQVFSEILNNFWSHAKSDNKSIIVAHGRNDYVEIACADNGDGIIDTMKIAYPKCAPKSLLSRAIEKGVTSKRNSNHMGYGLWFINEITRRVGGRLMIITDRYMYTNSMNTNKIVEIPYWKGTVVHVKLPLIKPYTIADMEPEHSQINIHFI